MLTTDVRKNVKYFPCCRKYEEGADLTCAQMGEFLEHLRVNMHKPPKQRLGDSMISNLMT